MTSTAPTGMRAGSSAEDGDVSSEAGGARGAAAAPGPNVAVLAVRDGVCSSHSSLPLRDGDAKPIMALKRCPRRCAVDVGVDAG